MRTSPLYGRLLEKGAIHMVVQGYEKPLWFKTDKVQCESLTWGHSEAHEVVAEECRAVRDAAGIVDLSGATKFEVRGKDAFALLDRLSCNKLPARDGRMTLTLFHAANGGIMGEMSITRFSEELYYLNGAIISEHKDLQWLKDHADGLDVEIKNVTDEIASVLLTGPKSRDILQQMTEEDLSHKMFPWLSARR